MKTSGNPFKKIRCILFDLDNTLYPSDPVYRQGLYFSWQYLKKYQAMPYPRFLKLYEQARKKVKTNVNGSTSMHNRILYFKILIETICGKPIPALILGMNQAYEKCWDHMELGPAQRILKPLSQKYRLGIITNQICLTQMQKMQRIDPNFKWFKMMLTSEELNAEKPSLKIFKEACRRLQCAPKECIMVGDDWDADIVPALKLGFQPIFVGALKNKLKARAKKVYCIKDISELNFLLNP